MTYASLLTDLRSYIERGGSLDTQVFDQLPTLINNTERDLATKFRILGTKNVVTDTMSAGVSVYQKPNRWRSTTSINFGVGTPPNQERTPMFPRQYEYLRALWPNTELTDVPGFYADYDQNHWLFAPTPDQDYPFEVIYWQLLPLLDDTNQTNFWTDYAPQALLYGTLLYCTPYLKNDERIPTWQAFYQDQLQSLSGQDLLRIADNLPVRKET
jgi:hypothetical protein